MVARAEFDFGEKFPEEIPLVVLDTETTGLHPGRGDRVVELAAVRLENWQVVGELNSLIQPGRKMDPRASAVNGIRDVELVGQPVFEEIAGSFLELVEGALLVAHNASFDAGFLAVELFISGHAPPADRRQPVLPNPWLCTLQLARRRFHFGRNSLLQVARQLGVRFGRAHRAMNDVYITTQVLRRMVQELGRHHPLTVGDLLHAQGEAIYMPAPTATVLPKPISEAFQRQMDLHILYISERSGESQRVITPLYVSDYHGSAYLIAYCHLRREQRTFRLDRIFSAELVPPR